MSVCYLVWRSSRKSEFGLKMKPESEFCEMAPTPKDSWAKQTRAIRQLTPIHLVMELTDTAAPPPLLNEYNAMLFLGLLTRKINRCDYFNFPLSY